MMAMRVAKWLRKANYIVICDSDFETAKGTLDHAINFFSAFGGDVILFYDNNNYNTIKEDIQVIVEANAISVYCTDENEREKLFFHNEYMLYRYIKKRLMILGEKHE
jgi:hypothetical protein